MLKLNDIRDAYIAEGISYLDAGSRVCQDVILAQIAKSPLAKNVTIKGGVVLRHFSDDSRRTTQDLDFDFIKYSISDESIKVFISKLNNQAEVSLEITAPIEKLKHQDYSGKRVYIRITDREGTSIDTKLDIGVHKDNELTQKPCCFDLGKLDDSICLLANTKEQIFTEKLKSLLRLGTLSTRYKDVFDMYYLACKSGLNRETLMVDLKIVVFDDTTMREDNLHDIRIRLEKVLTDLRFIDRLYKSKRHNWLAIEPEQAAKEFLEFFNCL